MMWSRFERNGDNTYNDPVLACRTPLYGSTMRIGPEVIRIDHLFTAPRGTDGSRFSLYTPFFIGIVEYDGELWVVYELKEDGPRVFTPRAARKVTRQERETLESYVRKHSSLAFFASRRDHYLEQVRAYWEVACEMLVDVIPTTLEPFARSVGWYKDEDIEKWELPTFMIEIWNASKVGNTISLAYEYARLATLELATAEAVLQAFSELKAAWAGMISLDIQQDETGIRVIYSIAPNN